MISPSHTHAADRAGLTNDDLANQIKLLSASSHASHSTIGTSHEGNPIHLLTLSAGNSPHTDQPAMLITAGIDGRYLAGSNMAIGIAEQLLADHQDLLSEMTIYIIPRANPDGAQRNLSSLTMGHIGNAATVDSDRDRRLDEDGPDDLNNDGIISMMRRLNPPLKDLPTHLADPDDQRLNIKPDAKEGQLPTFTLYTEGLDNDSDGSINEDGFGTVDLNKNFMHRWPEHKEGAGAYPLSEPEAHALAKFVLEHDNIIAALTIDRHDNLTNTPESKKKDITGTAPMEIDELDADLYKRVAEIYKENVGSHKATNEDSSGSFYAWLYAQRGIASFAAKPWHRPDPEQTSGADSETTDSENDNPPVEGNRLTPSGVGDISQETLDELMEAYVAMTGESVDQSMIDNITPDMIEGFAAQAGIEVRRVVAAEPEESKPTGAKAKKKELSEDAKWLNYFDEANIQGFTDWQPFDHPTLGAVEIGGFHPLAKINPPADQMEALIDSMTEFTVELLSSKPEVHITGPEITKLSDGVYEVHLSLMNHGSLPTATSFARSKRFVKPIVIRLSAEADHIITGQRIQRIWGLDANGGRSDHHWIIRTNNINNETITIMDPKSSDQELQLGGQK